MGPGLEKLLELVSKKPSDSILIDRFLVLAADIPELERADATLKLTRVLMHKKPRRALELGWMVYQSGHRSAESLRVICDAFDVLGLREKAELIRDQIRKLGQEKLADDLKSKARETILQCVSSTLATLLKDPVTFEAEKTQSELQTAPDLEVSEYEEGAQVVSSEALESPELQKTEIVSGFIPPLELMARGPLVAESAPRDVTPSPIEQNPNLGIPQAIPPKEPSYMLQRKFNQKQVSETNYSRPASESEENKTKHSAYAASPTDFAAKFKDLMLLEDWDHLLDLLENHDWKSSLSFLLHEFANSKLHKIDIRFAMWWVFLLIADGQERRALRFMIVKLEEEPHLAWARKFWPRVEDIAGRLQLHAVEWRESDGVQDLKQKIQGLRPRLGVYVA